MEKLYIVYQEDSDNIFLVKANNKKKAIDMVYQNYIKPFQKDDIKRGYAPCLKSDLTAKSTIELLGNDEIVMLT